MGVTEYEFTVRPFVTDDREAVAALWRRVFTGDPPWNEPNDMIARKESVQPDLFLVGVLGERVAGTVLAGFDGVRGWVHHLAVLPEFRRKGFASLLMDRAEEGLLELGCPKLNLQVRADNADVVAFYESLGFDMEARISMGKLTGE